MEMTRYLMTNLEKETFAMYLEHEAIAGELEIMDLRRAGASEEVVRRSVREVAAERIVAAKLRSETQHLI